MNGCRRYLPATVANKRFRPRPIFHKIDAPVLKQPVTIFRLRNKTGLALQFSDDRFEVFPDPVDNWIVWDRDENDFAEVGTHILWSLPQSRAEAFCFLLNKLFSKADRSA